MAGERTGGGWGVGGEGIERERTRARGREGRKEDVEEGPAERANKGVWGWGGGGEGGGGRGGEWRVGGT